MVLVMSFVFGRNFAKVLKSYSNIKIRDMNLSEQYLHFKYFRHLFFETTLYGAYGNKNKKAQRKQLYNDPIFECNPKHWT